MSNPRRIVILSGGISHERDVSLRSGRRAADALKKAGHDVIIREPDATLLPFLDDYKPHLVWPLLHGSTGENGAMYSLLRASGIPYIGSRPSATRFAWNKADAKALARRAGIRTPKSLTLENSTFRELGATNVISSLTRGLTLPAVVKPVEGGSAQGVSYVERTDEFPGALVKAFTYLDRVLIEQKIEGPEVLVTVLDTGSGPSALPAVEVEASSGIFDYSARYNPGETTYYVPPRVSGEAMEEAAEMALSIYSHLGLSDLARVDFIVDSDGKPWFLEVDPIPGLTETSIAPMAMEAAGLNVAEVYNQLVERALRDTDKA